MLSRSGQCEKNISREPPDQRRIWNRRSVRLIGAVPRNASGSIRQYIERHPVRCSLKPVTTSSVAML
ncbi:hypothetical protein U9M48_015546 [Paspalum notatum var. saurae]|uniref:Uncharacterized protein n=1 Tax=Paspalum notatum var. saurae TaxID=547442 RepID=A0AAQ3T552_PASNO